MTDRVNGIIPTDISLGPLVDEELLSVVIGKNHIELVFEHMRLNVEGGYEILQTGSSLMAASRENLRSGAALLAKLVGCTVARAEWVTEKGLRLQWADGSEFTAMVDGSGYESFSFNVPEAPGVVVV